MILFENSHQSSIESKESYITYNHSTILSLTPTIKQPNQNYHYIQQNYNNSQYTIFLTGNKIIINQHFNINLTIVKFVVEKIIEPTIVFINLQMDVSIVVKAINNTIMSHLHQDSC